MTRNKYCFGLGTVGRDMLYTLVSMYLLFYLTDILNLPDSTMWWMTAVLTVLRVFDAVNDPFMGVLVDNTKSRYGKFKPWIAVGAVLAGVFTVLMFTDTGMTASSYIVFFTFVYLTWDIVYGANDIAYWSMLPSLTIDLREREKIGSFAKICANVGMYIVVVAIIPVTEILSRLTGSAVQGWFVFSLIVAGLLLLFQSFTVFGVKEMKGTFKEEEKTTLREMFSVIFKNDQLMVTAVAMALFMIGYCTTTSFGVYFFKYGYKDESMYSVFAGVLGVSQITALSLFPVFAKRYNRKRLYTFATAMVAAGYIVFFFAPMKMIPIGIAGILVFIGEAFISILMLMFLTDTIEYGQWKFRKRNESITFSIQPFINKIGGAIANGIVGITVIIAGINRAETPEDVTSEGLLIMKLAMLVLPLIFIAVGYFIYLSKFKIDDRLFEQIVAELKQRGDIRKPYSE
ncbi:MAG: MFS transporter [Clostridiaceae bacterium]|nr:MFS transporter [Clostridiaceae bacterium]